MKILVKIMIIIAFFAFRLIFGFNKKYKEDIMDIKNYFEKNSRSVIGTCL